MKFLLIICLYSAIVYAAASDGEKSSPVGLPRDKVRLMRELSKQSQKKINIREQNPYVLPLASRLPRSKSNPEQVGGSIMLIDELSEARREAHGAPNRVRRGSYLSVGMSSISTDLQEEDDSYCVPFSPRRDLPASPGRGFSPRALVRVASLSACEKAMDAVDEREKRKKEYRNQLNPLEQRIFDVVGLKNLEFIKTQPNLLQVLAGAQDDEIDSWYKAYLRSTILILQSADGLHQYDSSDQVIRVIRDAQQDDLSPRKDSANMLLEPIRDRIKLHLAAAKKEANFLIGEPRSVEEIASFSLVESMGSPSLSGLNS